MNNVFAVVLWQMYQMECYIKCPPDRNVTLARGATSTDFRVERPTTNYDWDRFCTHYLQLLLFTTTLGRSSASSRIERFTWSAQVRLAEFRLGRELFENACARSVRDHVHGPRRRRRGHRFVPYNYTSDG